LALIAYELIANAAEHGHVAEGSPGVTVSIEPRGVGRAALVVEDNGYGLPTGLDPENQSSLGFTIVRIFAASLSGSFDIQNKVGGKGARAVADFPLL
jgi:two-component sensor histidine kinase